jgi:hypothetical protein
MNRPFLAYFLKGGLCHLHAVSVFQCLRVCEFVCLCICEFYLTNFGTPEPIFMKFSIYIKSHEPILLKSVPSICVSLCASVLSLVGKCLINCISLFVDRQLLVELHPTKECTHNNRRIVGRVVSYAIRVVSKERK